MKIKDRMTDRTGKEEGVTEALEPETNPGASQRYPDPVQK